MGRPKLSGPSLTCLLSRTRHSTCMSLAKMTTCKRWRSRRPSFSQQSRPARLRLDRTRPQRLYTSSKLTSRPSPLHRMLLSKPKLPCKPSKIRLLRLHLHPSRPKIFKLRPPSCPKKLSMKRKISRLPILAPLRLDRQQILQQHHQDFGR